MHPPRIRIERLSAITLEVTSPKHRVSVKIWAFQEPVNVLGEAQRDHLPKGLLAADLADESLPNGLRVPLPEAQSRPAMSKTP